MQSNTLVINQAANNIIIVEGILQGEKIIESQKTIGHLKNIFQDEVARQKMDQQEVVYSVQSYLPVEAGTEGGLFFGTTFLNAGMVGEEYFITQGHFHKQSNRAEYYWGIKGNGVLILMDKKRNYRAEYLQQGSLHYIPAHTAHRVANIGSDELVFNACWPSDAGYDYEEIIQHGFSCRLLNKDGKPTLVNT
ncbi:MAG: glucose-6-phosphate isomerase family protein [Parafilimonas sp.]